MTEKHARNLVVMLTAGGALDDVLEMARAFGVRAVHVQQLAVPVEEQAARRQLVAALQTKPTARDDHNRAFGKEDAAERVVALDRQGGRRALSQDGVASEWVLPECDRRSEPNVLDDLHAPSVSV